MNEVKRFHRAIAGAMIIALLAILAWALYPFIKGILGALILFILFQPLQNWLVKKRNLNRSVAAILVIMLSLIIIILPFATISGLLIGEINDLLSNKENIVTIVQNIDNALENFGIKESASDFVANLGGYIKILFVSFIENLTNIVINMTIMYFLLYYLLISCDELKTKAISWIPFNKKHAQKLLEEAKRVAHATIFSTGAVALIQGTLLAIGFTIFKIPGALFWGFIGFVAAFLPIIGITLIWLPAGIIMLSLGNLYSGIGILIWGLFISTIDNFLRPAFSKKIGKLHPLITLIGIFIGVPIFGILGIVMGPLLLSYFFSIWKMFNEEYIN